MGWLIPPWVRWAALALVLTLAVTAYQMWRSSVSRDAVQEIKIEQQTNQIKKLENATTAEDHIRRAIRSHPDSLLRDDGYRRD